MKSLPVFLALDGKPVILLGNGAAAIAKARLLERAGARIEHEETAEARIAIVAVEDSGEAEDLARRLKLRGVLVNVVDRPDLCDFTLPAIVDRSPVLIAIGTGGASASLAKSLRQWLERVLPASLGRLAHALHGARAGVKTAFPDAADRRAFLDRLLAGGGALDPLADHEAPDVALAKALGDPLLLDDRIDRLVVTSADPDDLTLRAARLLASADRIYHQPGIPPAILDRARADAERIAISTMPADLPPGRSVFLEWNGR